MYLESLSDTDRQKKIYDEFNTSEEKIKNDLRILMEWLEKQLYLPNVTDEDFLANVLIRCKNSLEKAKKKLECYYIARAKYPELLGQRNDLSMEKLKEMYSVISPIPLPKLTSDGDRVVLWRIMDSTKLNLLPGETALRINWFNNDLLLKTDKQRKIIVIYDMSNVTMSFMTSIIASLRKIYPVLENGIPVRFHKLYVINTIPAMESLMPVLKGFMTKKFFERFQIWSHKTSTNLSDTISKNLLPVEYGGNERSFYELRDSYLEYVYQHRHWLSLQNNIKADLSKIPDELKQQNPLFGIDGSFRSLDVD